MDQQWLTNLDHNVAVIVPTRSLANTLNEQIASYHIKQGRTVWEAPNILMWQDYLQILWQRNRSAVAQMSGSQTIISARQATLLWTQVIEASRREEHALTLLDVQQTVRAVQRSWRLMNDWGIELETLREDHVADTEQFLTWVADYQALLGKRGLMDEPLLQRALLELNAAPPFTKMVWYCYDLITASQRQFIQQAEEQSCEQEFTQINAPSAGDRNYCSYVDSLSELQASLQRARDLIEADPKHTINIVIPDLQHRQAAVHQVAREIFYPGVSPLELQLTPTVYRFSLGQPLNQWPAIETALRLIKLLNNRTTVAEFSFLLRNQFLANTRRLASECLQFERWLKRQRIRQILVDRLPELYQQCQQSLLVSDGDDSPLAELLQSVVAKRQQLQEKLSSEKQQNGFAALSFADWVATFDEWLGEWGWRVQAVEQELNSVQYQLHQRWQSLLEEFAGLGLVQTRVGLSRALEIVRQMASDNVFQPQAVASPILISGIFEAIGRPIDSCFVLGMDQHYPPQPQADAFIPNRLLRERAFPDAGVDSSFAQAKRVSQGLLAAATNQTISYSVRHERDREIDNQVSPLFRDEEFAHQELDTAPEAAVSLDQYQDTQATAWPADKHTRGGTKIFEHQSVCAFRAFVTHRLGFLNEDEAEFGLDALDRGNIVHVLLDHLWGKLQTQAQLLALSDEALDGLISETVDEVCNDPQNVSTEDKSVLLQHERPRLHKLLAKWLAVEKKRPIGFSVVEREEQRIGNVGGIQFKYVVDRLDLSDDGRSLIIDYKTGLVDRNDWLGERIKSPQMPLYAIDLDRVKRQPVAGITYAKVQQLKPEFVDLCEADIVRTSNSAVAKREELWKSQRAQWPDVLQQVAADFLAGQAQVNPVDEKTCSYCELQAVCRISQLKEQSVGQGDSHD